MHLVASDWFVLVVACLFFAGVAAWGSRYSKGVTGFLVGGRCAGRYLLTIAGGMVWIDAINIVGMFELFYLGGFPALGWGLMIQPPLAILMAVFGWAVYRFRETRAMTVPQYLEIRYSRGVRVTAGILAWIAGMINFGIYPAVSAHFISCFCGFPEHFTFAGTLLPTFPVLMAGIMTVILLFVYAGGHITVLVMDFCQGLFINIAAILLILLIAFSWLNWHEVMEVLQQAPAGASMLDPSKTGDVKDFNLWFFIIASIGMFYTRLSSFQGQAFDASALTPHEGLMSNVFVQIRWHTLCLFFMVMVLAAQTALHHPSHTSVARLVDAWLDVIEDQHGAAVRGQMTVSAALAFILPAGWKGLLLAVVVAAMLSSKSAFIHSFGSIFVQDVVMPFRKRPLSQTRHLRLLRLSILGVAVFSVVFGCFYRQTESILMYFALSSTLWLGGSGAFLIGGLYWSRGNTAGTYAAMSVGVAMGLAGFAAMQGWKIWFGVPFRFTLDGRTFELNPQWWFFATMIGSTFTYVAVSLATGRGRRFDLDRLLHRGLHREGAPAIAERTPPSFWKRICGITPEFNAADRVTVYLIFGWIFAWFAACVTMIVLAIFGKVGDPAWAWFWTIYLIALFGLLLGTTVWFGLGGLRDLREMLRLLRAKPIDESDDGTVES